MLAISSPVHVINAVNVYSIVYWIFLILHSHPELGARRGKLQSC